MLNHEPLSDEVFKTANLCVVGNINRDIKLAPIQAGPHIFEDGETPLDWTAESEAGAVRTAPVPRLPWEPE